MKSFEILAAVALAAAVAACASPQEDAPQGKQASASKQGAQTKGSAAGDSARRDTQPPPRPNRPTGPPRLPSGLNLTAFIYEDSLLARDRIAAGLRPVALRNGGDDDHELVVMRIPSGVGRDDARRAIIADTADRIGIVAYGGPMAGPDTTESATAYVELRRGAYAAACFRRHPDGRTHAATGELAMLDVIILGRTSELFTPPRSDGTVRLLDGEMRAPATLRQGLSVLLVENVGTRAHTLTIVRDASADSAPADSTTGAARPGPGRGGSAQVWRAAGGVSRMSPRRSLWLAIQLPAGRYRMLLDASPERGGQGGAGAAKATRELTVVR